MSGVGLYKFLSDSFSDKADERTKLWLALCLAVAAIVPVKARFIAFGGAYVVQSDARAHVFWMRRWLDPELFPDDIMAD